MHVLRGCCLAALLPLLAACGSATPLQRGDSAARLDSYTRAVVIPLADATHIEGETDSEIAEPMDAEELEDYRRQVTVAGRAFAEALAEELEKFGTFRRVVVDEVAQPGDLVIGGEVTRLVAGNFAARFAIGITGAGRSEFMATIRLSDAASGAELGTLQAGARSSRLGGTFAAIQSAEVLARDAGFKAAVEVRKAVRAE